MSLLIRLCLLFSLSLCIASPSPIPSPDASGKYTIRSSYITASFIPYSAAITNLFVADRNGTQRDIVLGYDNASTYATDPIHPNYGAIPGRYANRIGNATYVLDGTRYYTQRNSGNSTMHSGTNGWSYRVWNVSEVCEDKIVFTLRDVGNSSMGMPGLVLGKVTYQVKDKEWRIKIEATAPEHKTPLMATNHAYWNLDAFANPGNSSVLNHTLSLPYGKRTIGFDSASEPDGSLPDVPKWSINDFWSSPKRIGSNATAPGWVGLCAPGIGGYDCGWLVDRSEEEEQNFMDAPIASLSSDWSGIRWDLFSNQAGMAFTNSPWIPDGLLPIKKTQGGPGSSTDGFVPPSGGAAIEASDWLGGINYPQWGRLDKQIWGPDKGTYVNEMVYRFSIV